MASCYKFGKPVGGKLKLIQNDHKDLIMEREDCIDLVKQKEPDANGAMFDRFHCFANFGMVGTNSKKSRRTCSFPDIENWDIAKCK